MGTVREAVRATEAELARAGVPDARLDSELLLRHVLGWNRAQLLTRREQVLPPDAAGQYGALVQQRARRRPLQYIVGEQEFYGAAFYVTEDVLIPRPETELLIETALGCLPEDRDVRIVDIGTGSGAIAVTLARLRPRAHVLATDISSAALTVARRNADRHGVCDRVEFVEADLLPADCGVFDLVASNPPYVPSGDAEGLQPEVGDFEPAAALYAGIDGLDIYRRLVPAAAAWLRAGGALVLEIGAGQDSAVLALLGSGETLTSPAIWRDLHVSADLHGIPRTVLALRV